MSLMATSERRNDAQAMSRRASSISRDSDTLDACRRRYNERSVMPSRRAMPDGSAAPASSCILSPLIEQATAEDDLVGELSATAGCARRAPT